MCIVPDMIDNLLQRAKGSRELGNKCSLKLSILGLYRLCSATCEQLLEF